ncbi:MAG: hypothetical protein ACRDNB_01580 [Gaiellaceae bacterium]
MRERWGVGHRCVESEQLIEREEVVALLFAASDINVTLVNIENLLRGEDDEAEEAD